MDNRYRFVFDNRNEIAHLVPRGDEGEFCAVRGDRFRLLRLLSGEGAHTSRLPPVKAKKALQYLLEIGAICRDLQLQGSIQSVSGPHHLQTVQIEMLLKCNLSCGYCYCSAGLNRKEALSKKTVLKILEDCAALGVLTVDFTGGEFLLYRGWDDLIGIARRLGLGVKIHTNGTALNERNVAVLSDNRVRHVQVSFDSHIAETHDAVRGLDGGFLKSLSAIDLLKKAGISTNVALMVHRHNVDSFADTFRYFMKLCQSVSYDWTAPFGAENIQKSAGVSPSEFFKAVAGLRPDGFVLNNQKPCGRDVGRAPDEYEPPCGIGYSYLFITATGEIAICPTLTSREDPVVFGGPNVHEIGLFDAWTTHPFFDRHRYVNCKNVETCPAGQLCRGGCRANAYAISKGDLRAPDIISCNARKNATDEFVDFAARYAAGNYKSVL